MADIKLDAVLLKKLLPNISQANIDKYLPILQGLLPKYGITTPERVAAYFAQVGHESSDFTISAENMYYSTPQRLVDVWPSRFSLTDKKKHNPNDYIKNPEKLANEVYANRMGNGDAASGDGYRYRGRGSMQITGKESYRNYSMATYGDARCVQNPELIAQPLDYIQTSLWEWKKGALNAHADRKDIKRITQIINGGLIGYLEREKRYKHCCEVLGIKPA